MATTNGWIWFGSPGHFIGGASCRFHMATQVGRYLVSTVGDYYPPFPGTRTEVGYKRFFETMVFKAGKACAVKSCGCGMPTIDGSELDFEGYNTAGAAQKGHLAMCEKWAAKK
jgi:hypothetical protein